MCQDEFVPVAHHWLATSIVRAAKWCARCITLTSDLDETLVTLQLNEVSLNWWGNTGAVVSSLSERLWLILALLSSAIYNDISFSSRTHFLSPSNHYAEQHALINEQTLSLERYRRSAVHFFTFNHQLMHTIEEIHICNLISLINWIIISASTMIWYFIIKQCPCYFSDVIFNCSKDQIIWLVVVK